MIVETTHDQFCKQTPDKSLEENAVGIINQEGGNTETEPSQVTNHSVQWRMSTSANLDLSQIHQNR